MNDYHSYAVIIHALYTCVKSNSYILTAKIYIFARLNDFLRINFHFFTLERQFPKRKRELCRILSIFDPYRRTDSDRIRKSGAV